MAPARIHLVRHAAVAARGRLCGWYDAPLSEAGRAQLRALADRVQRLERPDALYASPLTRARETAAVLAEGWGLPLATREALREIGCGALDGEPLDVIERTHPALWQRNLAQADDAFAWPGGESYREFRARVVEGVECIARAHAGARLVIVTHAGVINQIVGAICGHAPAAWEPWRPDPMSVTDVIWGNGARELRSFNRPL